MYKISYTGDGISNEFNFTFPFFQNADIRVSINNTVIEPSGVYDINSNENFTGGTVVFVNPPLYGSVIDIFRKIELSRIVDYQPTAKIDTENLNTDFNFILEAFRDLNEIDIDLMEWKNIHNNVLSLIEYTKNLIEDKLSGGATIGLYSNLLSVLNIALPSMINDYGSVANAAATENSDDYGIL